jgi:hypothetical protein
MRPGSTGAEQRTKHLKIKKSFVTIPEFEQDLFYNFVPRTQFGAAMNKVSRGVSMAFNVQELT